MTEALDILITKVERSKLNEMDFDNLPFGKYFTDHMLAVSYTHLTLPTNREV